MRYATAVKPRYANILPILIFPFFMFSNIAISLINRLMSIPIASGWVPVLRAGSNDTGGPSYGQLVPPTPYVGAGASVVLYEETFNYDTGVTLLVIEPPVPTATGNIWSRRTTMAPAALLTGSLLVTADFSSSGPMVGDSLFFLIVNDGNWPATFGGSCIEFDPTVFYYTQCGAYIPGEPINIGAPNGRMFIHFMWDGQMFVCTNDNC